MTTQEKDRAARQGLAEQAEEAIAARRAVVDEIDNQIIQLLHHRLRESRAIQRIRIAAGGTRICTSREREIVRRYGAVFGYNGAELATILLRICRGPIISSGFPALSWRRDGPPQLGRSQS